MFRQIKSAIFWTLLYKFRKRLTIVVLLLSMVLLSQWIYSDLVEFLNIQKQTQYLGYLLLGKWLLIFTNIGISAYLILTIFKKEKIKNSQIKEEKLNDKQKNEQKKDISNLSNREKSFLKKKLRSEAEIIMDNKKK